MKFEYILEGVGWANVRMEMNKQQGNFYVSYLTDALGDLVDSILRITPGLVSDSELREEAFFEWDEEPAIDKWNIKRIDNDILEVKITNYPHGNMDDSVYKEVINTEIEIYKFVGLVVSAMDKILKNHGLIGYKIMWCQYDFPLTGYIRLKYYLENRTGFPVNEFKRNGYYEKTSSDLKTEIDFLKRLVINC